MQLNVPLPEEPCEGRLDNPTTRLSHDAVASSNGQPAAVRDSLYSKNVSSSSSSKRSLPAFDIDDSGPSCSKLDPTGEILSLQSLTYDSLVRKETGRLMCSSMPALGYVHDEMDEQDDDGQHSRVQWIANALHQVTHSANSTNDSSFDSLPEEEAALARHDYGYGNDSAGRFEQKEPSEPASPFKRRRVMRRNSFVIPRGRGLVPGLLELQDAGKFHFGANDGSDL